MQREMQLVTKIKRGIQLWRGPLFVYNPFTSNF
jgi:hypothetical protein